MKKLLASLITIVYCLSASAQWSNDPTANTLVTNASSPAVKNGLVSCTDGAGGMFVAWIDSRVAASQSIYVQRILSGGTLKFSPEVELTSSANVAGGTSVTKSNLSILADGAGGAICVWQDARNTTGSNSSADIYGQRVDANGNLLWTVGGRRLTVATNATSSKTVPKAALLNSTEALVLFSDNRLGNIDLFSQKIAIGNGATAWSSDIAIHGNQPNTQTPTSADLVEDDLGGAFIVWADPRLATTNADIYGQRIDNAGTLLWGSGGINFCNAANNQLAPRIVKDGAGGSVVVWGDLRVANTNADIYTQRINNAGVAQWTANGVAVCSATGNQSNPALVKSGSNFIISWSDARVAASDLNLYAQSISASGVVNWTANGVGICTATGNQPSSQQVLLADGNNGAILYWDDARATSSNNDIYAQNINSDGVVQWTANGVVVSSATGNQQAPVAEISAPGVSLSAWRDSRTATNSSIYASRLSSLGTLGGALNQTITFAALPAKTYGDADFSAGAVSSNSSIPLTYTSSNTAVATIVNGNIHIVGAGTTTITASQAGDAIYNPASDVSQVLTVAKAPLTVKADDKVRNQGFPNPAFTITYTGFVNGDNTSSLTTLPTAATSATINSAPGTYPIITSGGAAANYNLNYQNGLLTVNVFTIQVISFGSLPVKTYGDADFATGASSNSSAFSITYTSSDPSVATVVNGFIHIVGAGSTTITASQAGDANNQAAPDVSQVLVVNKAALTITADNKSKFVGQANPALTATYSGFVNGETASNLTAPLVMATTATTSSPVGTYPITLNGAASPNYTITFVNGVLTVNPLITQSITFNALPTKTYGNADFSLTATSTNNTIPVTYTSSNTSVATVSGNVVHIVGAGTTTITASQGGSSSFSPATSVSQVLTVSKAPLSITADSKTKLQGEANPAFTITYTGFVNGETADNLISKPSITNAATTNSPMGIYSLAIAGATSNNYAISFNAGILTILPSTGKTEDRLFVFSKPSKQAVVVRVYINTPLLGATKATIRLVGLNGVVVSQKEAFLQQGFTEVLLPVVNAPSGMFIVSVVVANLSLSDRVGIFK